MATEKIYFNESGIAVTSARIVFGGRVYPLGGITSAGIQMAQPEGVGFSGCVFAMLAGPFTILFWALLWVAISNKDPIGIAFFSVVSVAFIYISYRVYLPKPEPVRYQICLTTSSGEVTAFETTDRNLVNEIGAAIEEAIVDRASL